MLLRGLHELCHEFTQAFVIGEDDKGVFEEVLTPPFDDGSDSMEFANVGG